MALTDLVPSLRLKHGEQRVYQGSSVEDMAQALCFTMRLLRDPADVVLHPDAVEPLIVALSQGYSPLGRPDPAEQLQEMMRNRSALYVTGLLYPIRLDETLDPLAVGLVSRY